jgi:hypothetical protein
LVWEEFIGAWFVGDNIFFGSNMDEYYNPIKP